ncbi:hypothetical protein L873DRAFT_1791033 [Choiromyces venosus 120613-1]|uniref:Uncharacterized protein n=1 Tax=Choiromyces venosus 120613-1 TaxID=1336337 RepID=A0A3N4JGG9_9PEZI|nr:hypothetical protein L873DRAFT_1791033 [Choiromyces venosus 120613-1]
MLIESDIEGKDDVVFMGCSDSIFTIPDSNTSTNEESIHKSNACMDNNQRGPDSYIQDDQESLNNPANSSSLWFQFEERHTESDLNFPETDIHDENECHNQLCTTWNVLQQLLDVGILSISTLKCFREKIPSPQVIKSYVENGEKNYPFYHISLSDLIQMEMANEESTLHLQESSQIVVKNKSSIPILSTEPDSGVRIYREVWTAQK